MNRKKARVEKGKKISESKKRFVTNFPDLLCYLRIIFAFIIVYFLFLGFKLEIIIFIFVLAMLTDAIDGIMARVYKLQTEFGRKLDIIADRALMISLILAFVIYLAMNDKLTSLKIILFLIMLSRELIALPFFVLAMFVKRGNPIPKTTWAAKLTTVFQALTFPMIAFEWKIAIYLAILTGIFGVIAGILYIKSSLKITFGIT